MQWTNCHFIESINEARAKNKHRNSNLTHFSNRKHITGHNTQNMNYKA